MDDAVRDSPSRTARDRLDPASHLAHVRDGADRLAATIEDAPMDAPVHACPGWDLGALVRHVGTVHRWAALCIREVRAPTSEELGSLPPLHDAEPAGWYRTCAADLVAALAGIDPAAPTWHPFPVPQLGAFWPRRQAHEIAVHRWDAGHAIGSPPALDPLLAADGIAEYLEVILPRLVTRGRELPAGRVVLRCDDTDAAWSLAADGHRAAAVPGRRAGSMGRVGGRRGRPRTVAHAQTSGDHQ